MTMLGMLLNRVITTTSALGIRPGFAVIRVVIRVGICARVWPIYNCREGSLSNETTMPSRGSSRRTIHWALHRDVDSTITTAFEVHNIFLCTSPLLLDSDTRGSLSGPCPQPLDRLCFDEDGV